MPTMLHAFTVSMVGSWFAENMDKWRIVALLGVTTQVAAANFRILEISVLHRRPLRNEYRKSRL